MELPIDTENEPSVTDETPLTEGSFFDVRIT